MVSADVSNDDNGAKGKREAPMAEPSTDYLPPRLEAPYATYQPITVGATIPQTQYYQQQSPYSQQSAGASGSSGPIGPISPVSQVPVYDYGRYGVVPLQNLDNNDISNDLSQGQQYNSNSESTFNNNPGYNNNPGPPYNSNPGPPYFNNPYGVVVHTPKATRTVVSVHMEVSLNMEKVILPLIMDRIMELVKV